MGPASQTPNEDLIVDLVGRGVADEDARALEAHHRLAVELRDPTSGITLGYLGTGTGWLHVESGASRAVTLPLMKLVWWCLETASRRGRRRRSHTRRRGPRGESLAGSATVSECGAR